MVQTEGQTGVAARGSFSFPLRWCWWTIGGAGEVDRHSVQVIVQRYRSPYTALGWAFVRALRIQPRPPLPSTARHARGYTPTRSEVRECMRQAHGVDGL